MNPILEEIAKTSIQLMLKEPFYGHFFTSVLKDISDKTESVAVSLTGKQMLKLIVNEEYWQEKLSVMNALGKIDDEATKNLRYGAIKHQILHIVFKHILRVNEFGNKKLYGIAADLSANQYINSTQLTEDSIRLEEFPEFKLDRGQSIDYYYKRLSEELEELTKSESGGDGDEEEDTEDQNSSDNEQSDSDESDSPELNQAQQKLKELLEQEEHTQLNQHKFWEDMDKLSSAERKMMEAMINESILNSVQRIKSSQYG